MASTSLGGLGAGSYGSVPFGSAASVPIEIIFYAAWRTDAVIIVYSKKQTLTDAQEEAISDPDNWTLTKSDPECFDRNVMLVEDAAQHGFDSVGSAFVVFFDGPLTQQCKYKLTWDFYGIDMLFSAIKVSKDAMDQESVIRSGEIVDIKNPQVAKDKLPLGSLGTFNISDDGDYANDRGIESMRKRILRRIQTLVDEFHTLLGYGTNTEIKGNITPSLIERMRARVQAGVIKEPDVLRAGTRVYKPNGVTNIVVIQVKAISKFGEEMTAQSVVNFG